MKIGLDFDKTIFDTKAFIQDMPADPDTFKKAFEKAYLTGDYTLEKHVNCLENIGVKTEKEQLKNLYKNAQTYLKYRDYLQHLSETHELYLVTRADTKGWQQKKIRASKAEEYFENILIIYGDSLKDLPELDVLIDDSQEEITRVSEKTILLDPEESLKSALRGIVD